MWESPIIGTYLLNIVIIGPRWWSQYAKLTQEDLDWGGRKNILLFEMSYEKDGDILSVTIVDTCPSLYMQQHDLLIKLYSITLLKNPRILRV